MVNDGHTEEAEYLRSMGVIVDVDDGSIADTVKLPLSRMRAIWGLVVPHCNNHVDGSPCEFESTKDRRGGNQDNRSQREAPGGGPHTRARGDLGDRDSRNEQGEEMEGVERHGSRPVADLASQDRARRRDVTGEVFTPTPARETAEATEGRGDAFMTATPEGRERLARMAADLEGENINLLVYDYWRSGGPNREGLDFATFMWLVERLRPRLD